MPLDVQMDSSTLKHSEKRREFVNLLCSLIRLFVYVYCIDACRCVCASGCPDGHKYLKCISILRACLRTDIVDMAFVLFLFGYL